MVRPLYSLNRKETRHFTGKLKLGAAFPGNCVVAAGLGEENARRFSRR
jgi:hypothetical protein